jgi:hypothetical protein
LDEEMSKYAGFAQDDGFGSAYLHSFTMAGESISNGAQYGTPDSKIYCEKVKMCWFSSGNWLFCTKFVHLARGW